MDVNFNEKVSQVHAKKVGGRKEHLDDLGVKKHIAKKALEQNNDSSIAYNYRSICEYQNPSDNFRKMNIKY